MLSIRHNTNDIEESLHPLYTLWSHVRAIPKYSQQKLNSYIVILVSPKHKNPYYSSGVKGKIFTFITTMHSYIWLCTIAESLKKKKKNILNRISWIKIIYVCLFFYILLFSQLIHFSDRLLDFHKKLKLKFKKRRNWLIWRIYRRESKWCCATGLWPERLYCQ